MTRRALSLLPLLIVTGCSDSIPDMTCDDAADEAVGVSDGALIKISNRTLVSRNDREIVCRGMGIYAKGADIPTRFRVYIDSDGDEMVKYDTDEFQAAAEARANDEFDKDQRQAEQEFDHAISEAIPAEYR